MRFIEEVQIPLLVLPPTETYRLIRWRVPNGSYVMMGQVIFDLEVNDQIYAVESFYTGFIKITGTPGNLYKIGDSIGTAVCDQAPEWPKVIGIELTSPALSRLDELRGSIGRRDYLRDLVNAALTAPAGE